MSVRLGYSFAQAIAAADDPHYVAQAYGRFLSSLPNGSAYDTNRDIRSHLAQAEMRDRQWFEQHADGALCESCGNWTRRHVDGCDNPVHPQKAKGEE